MHHENHTWTSHAHGQIRSTTRLLPRGWGHIIVVARGLVRRGSEVLCGHGPHLHVLHALFI